jgi:hypothetical protein
VRGRKALRQRPRFIASALVRAKDADRYQGNIGCAAAGACAMLAGRPRSRGTTAERNHLARRSFQNVMLWAPLTPRCLIRKAENAEHWRVRLVPPFGWIVRVIIEGIAYDLIKSGAQWVLKDPPPIGKRPPVLYADGYLFRLQPNGNYIRDPVRRD